MLGVFNTAAGKYNYKPNDFYLTLRGGIQLDHTFMAEKRVKLIYGLPDECIVNISIYDDLNGEKINIFSSQKKPGMHTLDYNMEPLSEGWYKMAFEVFTTGSEHRLVYSKTIDFGLLKAFS